MEYITITIVAITITTFVVYMLANKVFGVRVRLKSLVLCAACALFISLVLPRFVVSFTGLAGTIGFLALFAVAFAYFIAYYDEPQPELQPATEGLPVSPRPKTETRSDTEHLSSTLLNDGADLSSDGDVLAREECYEPAVEAASTVTETKETAFESFMVTEYTADSEHIAFEMGDTADTLQGIDDAAEAIVETAATCDAAVLDLSLVAAIGDITPAAQCESEGLEEPAVEEEHVQDTALESLDSDFEQIDEPATETASQIIYQASSHFDSVQHEPNNETTPEDEPAAINPWEVLPPVQGEESSSGSYQVSPIVEQSNDTTDPLLAGPESTIEELEMEDDQVTMDKIESVDTAAYDVGEPVIEAKPVSDALDDLLDFAFSQKEQQNYTQAIEVFRRALKLYADSEAAPLIAFEVANLLKNRGFYDEAITVLSENRGLTALQQQSNLEQEFINTIAYLRIAKNVLLQRRIGFTPFPMIPPEVCNEIDAEFREWRNLA